MSSLLGIFERERFILRMKNKIIHIMSSDTSIHNRNIVKMINESSKFIPSRHAFYFMFEGENDELRKYGNCFYNRNVDSVSKLIQFLDEADILIMHGLNIQWWLLYFIPRKKLKKMVWVVWGHDLYIIESKNKLINYLKEIRWKLFCFRLKKIRAVGIGFKYDSLRIHESLRNVEILNMPYFQGDLSDYSQYQESIKSNHATKIMVGHASFEYLNHLEILEKLSKYKNENIIISLVLVYGPSGYAETVINKAISLFGMKKVEIIDKKMPYEQYVQYLKTVDIAILDYKHQAALGNFYLLCLFGKKMYLHKKGILKQCLILEGAKTFSTDCIGKISFDTFIEPVDDHSKKIMRKFAEYYFDKATAESNWLSSLSELEVF